MAIPSNSPRAVWQETVKGLNEDEEHQQNEEFFNDTDVLSEISSLVREAIQNSIDACLDNTKPVKVRFTLKNQTGKINEKYFKDLYPHAALSINENLLPKYDQNSNFLIIEDFNTTGLEGSVRPSKPKDSDVKLYGASYWFFEWAKGISIKKGDRGSWGIGKIVLSAASRYKSYFVYSVRKRIVEEGSEQILFGHANLKYENISDKRVKPNRRWMITNEIGEYIPQSESSQIKEFCSDWGVTRESSMTGTSIILPFCRDTITPKGLLQCIIQDYFIPIIDGSLECEIVGNNSSMTLNTNNIIGQILDLDEGFWTSATKSRDELVGLCNMYKNFINNKVKIVEIKQIEKSTNNWNEIMLDKELVDTINKDLDSGIIYQFKVETNIPIPNNKKNTIDYFNILLSKHNSNELSKTVFSRQGILIPNANRDSKLRGLLSLVVISKKSENSIAQILSDAEGPAHKSWSEAGDRVTQKYNRASVKTVISWIRSSALSINKLLQSSDEIPDDRSLSKYFPYSSDGGQNSSSANKDESVGSKGSPKGGKGGKGGKSRPAREKLLEIYQTENGFDVRPIDPELTVGSRFVIEVAYTMKNGDSFSSWSDEDFKLEEMYNKNSSSGAELHFKENIVEFKIIKQDFCLSFIGFDLFRDLSIELKKIAS